MVCSVHQRKAVLQMRDGIHFLFADSALCRCSFWMRGGRWFLTRQKSHEYVLHLLPRRYLFFISPFVSRRGERLHDSMGRERRVTLAENRNKTIRCTIFWSWVHLWWLIRQVKPRTKKFSDFMSGKVLSLCFYCTVEAHQLDASGKMAAIEAASCFFQSLRPEEESTERNSCICTFVSSPFGRLCASGTPPSSTPCSASASWGPS